MDLEMYSTVTEASQLIGCSKQLIRILAKAGRLEGSIKKGKAWLIKFPTRVGMNRTRDIQIVVI